MLEVTPPAADPQSRPDVAPDAPRVLPCPCPRCGARMIVIEIFARLPAELAADTGQDRHLMSQTFCERYRFPAPIRWLNADGDRSRSNSIHQCVDPALTRSEPPSKIPAAHRSPPVHADTQCRILSASRPSSSPAPALNPIALAAQPVLNFPRLRALALFGRRSVERAEPPCCRRPKTSTIADSIRSPRRHGRATIAAR
jgi:hypothetical protein